MFTLPHNTIVYLHKEAIGMRLAMFRLQGVIAQQLSQPMAKGYFFQLITSRTRCSKPSDPTEPGFDGPHRYPLPPLQGTNPFLLFAPCLLADAHWSLYILPVFEFRKFQIPLPSLLRKHSPSGSVVALFDSVNKSRTVTQQYPYSRQSLHGFFHL